MDQSAQMAAATAAAALSHKCETGQVKISVVWDTKSARLQKGSSKHAWDLSASFTSEVDCEFSAHFHCRETSLSSQTPFLDYRQADEAAPPSIKLRYGPGRHTVSLGGEHAINLQRFPLEVFWKYKQRKADVIPIVFSLKAAASETQSVMHLFLELTRAGATAGGPELSCKLLRQKVVMKGQEYTLQEIYGLADLGKEDEHDESSHGEPCVICLTEPRNTAVLPCRHLCCCEDCARTLSINAQLKGNTCPICRTKITGMQVFGVKDG